MLKGHSHAFSQNVSLAISSKGGGDMGSWQALKTRGRFSSDLQLANHLLSVAEDFD